MKNKYLLMGLILTSTTFAPLGIIFCYMVLMGYLPAQIKIGLIPGIVASIITWVYLILGFAGIVAIKNDMIRIKVGE